MAVPGCSDGEVVLLCKEKPVSGAPSEGLDCCEEAEPGARLIGIGADRRLPLGMASSLRPRVAAVDQTSEDPNVSGPNPCASEVGNP